MSKGSKKFVDKKDKKSEDDQQIQAVINSNYSIFIPYWNAEHIGVIHPLTRENHRFKATSDDLVSFLKELIGMGMEAKIAKDFQDLSRIDSRWEGVWNSVSVKLQSQES